MLQMMKKEFQLNLMSIILVIILIPAAYVLNISSSFLYIAMAFGFIFNAFYYDGKNHVNRFIKSLPIKPKHVVLGRYLLLFCISIILLIYLSIIDSIAQQHLPYLSFQPLTWIILLGLFAITSIISAISYPIYYAIQSFTIAIGVIIGVIALTASVIGIVLNLFHAQLEQFIIFILNFIQFQPALIIILFSMGCLFLSYLLSSWIYARKDIQ
ncbi:hypothetical protein CV093_15700 [Oceanobacillus sp. 143]|uniref:ABC-2 transporter permease n=1 Tax=Oceanobacillus zhaokaii TaxID=2052660 RepID=A0A345PJD3_9BACI|nr:ABC-2 transporter permease [Oceanobacillus zhaokaii]AXI10113.1 hypothetical protein CUC15_14760 [Oceanobacillus zhaokaii]QGS69243.1 hypothetical protein CV093_15700 [Oceanobacillus sp. 143]